MKEGVDKEGAPPGDTGRELGTSGKRGTQKRVFSNLSVKRKGVP